MLKNAKSTSFSHFIFATYDSKESNKESNKNSNKTSNKKNKKSFFRKKNWHAHWNMKILLIIKRQVYKRVFLMLRCGGMGCVSERTDGG